MALLGKRETILFQGDSITDCGRDRGDLYSLGVGYPLMVASHLSAACMGSDLTFINKGVSGDRACALVGRWGADCVDLKPTIVSILIGVNDTWRRYDSNDPTSTEAFEDNYRSILERTANETGAKIILLEPFVLPVFEAQKLWREDIDPKIQAVRRLSREFKTLYVPLDGIFAAASTKKPPEFWASDGVHPTYAGNGLIASEWVKAALE